MTRRLEHIAVNGAIAFLGGLAIVLKGIEAAEAYAAWKLKGKTL